MYKERQCLIDLDTYTLILFMSSDSFWDFL